jgi:NhaP-type Na+/H+ or K+/H+ antiporter
MATAIPVTTASGAPFPGRETIVAVGLGVIFVTIAVQGLTLRPLIRWLGFPPDHAVEEEERHALRVAERASLARLRVMTQRVRLPRELSAYFHAIVTQRTRLDLDDLDRAHGLAGQAEAALLRSTGQELRNAARSAIVQLRDDGIIGDDALRRVMSDLDLDDLRSAESLVV